MNMKRMVSADLLKWLALITMFIDHIGAGIIEKCYMPQLKTFDIIIRCIGRSSFPIFCFLLVEGYVHSRNRWKYALNLLIFAIISEIPFDYLVSQGFTWDFQNVYVTLLIGLLMMMVCGKIQERKIVGGIWIEVVVAILFAIGTELLKSDYASWGIVLIFILFELKDKPRWTLCLAGSLFMFTNTSEIPAIIAFIFIFLYNGKRNVNINKYKYLFYSFYPLHLAIYCGIRYLLMM